MIRETHMTIPNTELQGFELRWRFTDPKFNQLPTEDLHQIKPHTPEISRELWSKYVSAKYSHSIQFSKDDLAGYRRIKVDWNDKDAGRLIISGSANLPGDASILFFWSKTCSVHTKWAIFLKYWDDFCYRDDDNNVIVNMQTGAKMFYSEGAFLFP